MSAISTSWEKTIDLVAFLSPLSYIFASPFNRIPFLNACFIGNGKSLREDDPNMNQIILRLKHVGFFAIFGLTLLLPLFFLQPSLAASSLLKKTIIDYNLKTLKKCLKDGSYRGEEGILKIRPETGKSLGMKVFIDQNYLDSKDLFKKARKSLQVARRAMTSKKKEKFPGEYIQKISDHFLLHKKASELAKKKLKAYRLLLKPGLDERLNEAISFKVMDKLLEESLKRTDNKLRDALGCFYDLCQGVNDKKPQLTKINVRFVNEVFQGFVRRAPEHVINKFDLDRDNDYKNRSLANKWKDAIGKKTHPYIPLLEASINKFRNKIYAVDPLLFVALMKRESNFDPLAISPAGAAGLTQIIPKTAGEIGMRNIYRPKYLGYAKSLRERERKTRREAMAALFQINDQDKLQYARRARELMQKSLSLRKKKERLFALYKKELLKNRTDDRLQPAQSIEYGLKYFATLMKDHEGDMSLALASYNAGPHRVREFKGIPPYRETVLFRNKVLKYYRDYIRKAEGAL